MHEYLRCVQGELQRETTGGREGTWLLAILKGDDFWLRARHAPAVCKKLGLSLSELSYYVDIKVHCCRAAHSSLPDACSEKLCM